MNMYEKLKEYKALLDEGIITEAEFEKKKRDFLGMPDKEEEKRIAEENRLKEIEHQKKIEEDKKREAEHKRKLVEYELAEREHKRKLEEAKLLEEEKKRKAEEEKRIEIEKKKDQQEKQKDEKQIEELPTKGKSKKGVVIAIILVVIIGIVGVIVGTGYSGYIDTTNYNATYDWPDSGLAKIVPEPTIKKGKINNDNDTFFDFYLYKTTVDDFLEYVNACKESGYTDVEKETGTLYQAYNEDGDRYVDIEYYEHNSEIYVVVRTPEEWNDIRWPKSELAGTIPVPKELYGKITWDYSDSLDVDIANISENEFNDYIDECIKAGYDIDYSRDETSFSAKNKDGNELDIWYRHFDVMNIDLESDDE